MTSLTDDLIAAGHVREDHADAFRGVDRAAFVPDRYWYDSPDEDAVPVDRGAQPDLWYEVANSNAPIITQFDDGAVKWPARGWRPTASASAPSGVAKMLALADVQPGHAVLEIGTGTGYHAALLSRIVGPTGRVTTVEVDADAYESAFVRLRGFGVLAHLHDGTWPLPGGAARFDRVIVTATVMAGRMPYWWVASLRAGGRLVAPMGLDMMTGPVVALDARREGVAVGRATDTMWASYMHLRSHRPERFDFAGVTTEGRAAAAASTTNVEPWPLLLNDDKLFAVAVALRGCRYDIERDDDGEPVTAWLGDPMSGSWASVAASEREHVWEVRQHGPRLLWDEAVAAHRWWLRRGEPAAEDWWWRVDMATQTVTIDPSERETMGASGGMEVEDGRR